MGLISTVDARALFTKRLVGIQKDISVPTSFLRSFFKTETSNTKELSIEVQRGFQRIAVDVLRGTGANRNTFSKSSEKIFVPPFYFEDFNLSELDIYDRIFTENGTIDAMVFSEWMKNVIGKLTEIIYKIERAYELQCSQVLETGIVQLVNGTNIDYTRKAGSLVAYNAAHDFAINTVDPIKVLDAGAKFIRQSGKYSGTVFNVIMGELAFNAMVNNTLFKAKTDNRTLSLDVVSKELKESEGAIPQYELRGSFARFHVWTYPQVYDTKTASNNPYISDKKVIMIPDNPNFVLGFGAVPKLMGKKADVGAGISGQRGAYLVNEYLDEKLTAHVVDVKSAGLAIPVAVDQIYTVTVLN